MNTETLITFADSKREELHFEVPSKWLQEKMKEWALKADSDKEPLKNRVDFLYNKLSDDKQMTKMIYKLADNEGVIISSEKLIVKKMNWYIFFPPIAIILLTFIIDMNKTATDIFSLSLYDVMLYGLLLLFFLHNMYHTYKNSYESMIKPAYFVGLIFSAVLLIESILS